MALYEHIFLARQDVSQQQVEELTGPAARHQIGGRAQDQLAIFAIHRVVRQDRQGGLADGEIMKRHLSLRRSGAG